MKKWLIGLIVATLILPVAASATITLYTNDFSAANEPPYGGWTQWGKTGSGGTFTQTVGIAKLLVNNSADSSYWDYDPGISFKWTFPLTWTFKVSILAGTPYQLNALIGFQNSGSFYEWYKQGLGASNSLGVAGTDGTWTVDSSSAFAMTANDVYVTTLDNGGPSGKLRLQVTRNGGSVLVAHKDAAGGNTWGTVGLGLINDGVHAAEEVDFDDMSIAQTVAPTWMTPILNTLATGATAPYDLIDDGTSVWTNTSTTVFKINPTTKAIVSSYAIPGAVALGGITYAFGSIWVCDNGSNVIFRLDPSTLAVIATIVTDTNAGAHAIESIATTDTLFVFNNDGCTYCTINPATNTRTNLVNVNDGGIRSPYYPAKDASGNIWVTMNGYTKLMKIDPADPTNPTYVTLSAAAGDPQKIVFDGTDMWICDYGFSGGATTGVGNVYRFRPATNTLIATIYTGYNSLSGMYWDGTNPWVNNFGFPSNRQNYHTLKIDPATNTVSEMIVTGGNPWSTVISGGTQFVTNYDLAYKTVTVMGTKCPNISAHTNSSITMQVGIEGQAGNAYFVCLAHGAGSPTSAQVKAGQDGSGSGVSANLKGTASLTADTATTFSATSLSALTTYDLYVVADDGTNLQAAPTLLTQTTDANPTPTATPTSTVTPTPTPTPTPVPLSARHIMIYDNAIRKLIGSFK